MLPTLPLLKNWYAVVHDGDSLVLQYGKHIVKFEGKAVHLLLPSLLPLLDGHHTVAAIKERIGEPFAAAVEPALQKLSEQALLSDGPPNSESVPAMAAAALDFFSGGVLEPNQARMTTSELATKSVLLAGASDVADLIARQLSASGICSARSTALLPDLAEAGDHDLLVLAPSGAQYAEVRDCNRRLHERKLKWMLIPPHEGKAAFVGPIFVPGETACYECCLLRRESNVKFTREPYISATHATAFPQPVFVSHLIASVACYQIYQHLLIQSPWPVGRVLTLEFKWDIVIEPHDVLRVPRCPVCSPVAKGSNPAIWAQQ